MSRNIIIAIVVCFAAVGCRTPSDVHLGERRFTQINAEGEEVPAVVTEGRYWYTDPMTTMAAQGQMLWNYEMAKSLEAVRTATNDDELAFAKKQLETVRAAQPAEPVKVTGKIVNYRAQDLICVIYADESKARKLGRVILPRSAGPNGTERPFTLVKGMQAHFVFLQGNKPIGGYTLENPADLDWQAWIK